MFDPSFDITHNLLDSVVKLELALHDIKSIPLSIKAKKEFRENMKAENIFHLAKLVGVPANFRYSQSILNGKSSVSANSPGMVLANYRSTCDFIYSKSTDRYLALNPSLLLHLNKLLLTSVTDTWNSGRFRNASEFPENDFDKWIDIFDRKEINNQSDFDFQGHFFDVFEWFTDTKLKIHPIIKTAIVIYELVKIYPFPMGNQLTIIAISELLMDKTKISVGGLYPVSRFYALDSELLESAFKLSLESDNQTAWVEAYTKSLATDLRTLKNEIVKIEEDRLKKKQSKMLDLNSRQLKLLRQLKYKPKIYRRDYVDMMGVSTMTAYRDLNELVERKLIDVKGGGRSTYYMLTVDKSSKSTFAKKEEPEVVKVITDVISETV